MLKMEDSESTGTQRATEGHGSQKTDNKMSGKPLHRFVQKEPRCLGIVILIFGCAEMLMGFVLADEVFYSSYTFYVPVWQGALFLACGILSIYTELHPSKRMVTVCLAMYLVTIFGIIVSICFRIRVFNWSTYMQHDETSVIVCMESIMLLFSLCVSSLLIFLSTIARFALKSSHTQLVVQHIPLPPQSEATSN